MLENWGGQKRASNMSGKPVSALDLWTGYGSMSGGSPFMENQTPRESLCPPTLLKPPPFSLGSNTCVSLLLGGVSAVIVKSVETKG